MPDVTRFDEMRRLIDPMEPAAPPHQWPNWLVAVAKLIDEAEEAADGRGAEWRRTVEQRMDGHSTAINQHARLIERLEAFVLGQHAIPETPKPGRSIPDRLDALESAADETRNLVIGLGIDTTEETERLDAHVSALEAGACGDCDDLGEWGLKLKAERDEARSESESIFASQQHWKELAERFAAERDALHQQLATSRSALAYLAGPACCNPWLRRYAQRALDATTTEDSP